MPNLVVSGAMLQCSFGNSPSSLVATPGTVRAGNLPVATTSDIAPTNIPPFGMCSSMANPQVSAATSAAQGVLTPMPCVPVATTWVPGSLVVKVLGKPALTDASSCVCQWGGQIRVQQAGQQGVRAGQ